MTDPQASVRFLELRSAVEAEEVPGHLHRAGDTDFSGCQDPIVSIVFRKFNSCRSAAGS